MSRRLESTQYKTRHTGLLLTVRLFLKLHHQLNLPSIRSDSRLWGNTMNLFISCRAANFVNKLKSFVLGFLRARGKQKPGYNVTIIPAEDRWKRHHCHYTSQFALRSLTQANYKWDQTRRSRMIIWVQPTCYLKLVSLNCVNTEKFSSLADNGRIMYGMVKSINRNLLYVVCFISDEIFLY